MELVTEAVVDALRDGFTVAVRRARPRRDTHRAQLMRLPEVGVCFPHDHKGTHYAMRVVSEHLVECESDERIERYESLRAVATAILGYQPPIGGWRYFFGSMSPQEVSERYGKKG